MTSSETSFLGLRSRVTEADRVEVVVTERVVPEPGPDQVLVRVEAAPINPSDLGVLFAGADLTRAEAHDSDGRPGLSAPLPPAAVRAAAARVGDWLAAGTEGAGRVIAAGGSDAAQALVGKLVGVVGAPTYGQLCCASADRCLAFPEGTTAEQAAGWFVNPMTAQAILATMHAEGHTALVQTAAASSLGRMLIRLCQADGIPLVNIVRRAEHVAELAAEGAEYVCDSSSEHFTGELEAAIVATGATIAFDAVAGGRLASDILDAMEAALSRGRPFDRYGSDVHKQVYLYSSMDRGVTELARSYGMSWGVSGWLLNRALATLGVEVVAQMRDRVTTELSSTFATAFAESLSLAGALNPDAVRGYARSSSGAKRLINPAL